MYTRVSVASWSCLSVVGRGRSSLVRSTPKKDHDKDVNTNTYAVYTPPREEKKEEGRAVTRVSRPCWPCLRVVFLTNATRKKSQHTSVLSNRRNREVADLRRVRTAPPPTTRRERREVGCAPRK